MHNGRQLIHVATVHGKATPMLATQAANNVFEWLKGLSVLRLHEGRACATY